MEKNRITKLNHKLNQKIKNKIISFSKLSYIMSSDIWYHDPSVLYADGNYKNLIPRYGDKDSISLDNATMSNIFMRNVIVITVLFLLFRQYGIMAYVTIISILYAQEYDTYIPYIILGMILCILSFGSESSMAFIIVAALLIIFFYKPPNVVLINPDVEIQAGTFDEQNNINYGIEDNPYDIKLTKYYTPKQIKEYTKATCRKPTIDNPFMNPLVTEFNTELAPSACNADDENIQKNINAKFDVNLFMDVDDLFSVKNSQRQFYTIPAPSIPNNQTDFANWLYKSPRICKETSEACLRYEDIRFNSPQIN